MGERLETALSQPPKSSDALAAMARGSVGFAIVSLAAFFVWVVADKWLQQRLGEPGLYAACALVFLCCSGALLHPLVPGPGSGLRFYFIFVPAFVAYAVVWSASWFVLRFGPGEWLGSFLGTAAFAAAAGWRLRYFRSFGKVMLVLFGLHSAGYFVGGQLMRWLLHSAGSHLLHGLSKAQLLAMAKLSWGLAYGLGFGAGIGYVFHRFGANADAKDHVRLRSP